MDLALGSQLGINQFRFRTKSLGVDLYWVQDQFTLGRLSSCSELEKDEMRFQTKSLGVELY